MKFALIGVGRWGQVYIRNLMKVNGGSLVATSSLSMNKFDQMPHYLKSAPHFTSSTEMLKAIDIDTVIIATHPDSHFSLSSQALWYNKNVICEKPFTMTDDKVCIIEELSKGLVFYTDYTNLHHKIISTMRDIISITDKPIDISLTNLGHGPFRDSYSDIYDYGSHVISIVCSLFPDTYINISEYAKDSNNNHIVRIVAGDAVINCTFGNKSLERVHTFSISSGKHSAFWDNDKSENPLLDMLQNFNDRKIESNIQLSRRVLSILNKIDSMNKKLSIGSL